MTKTLRKLWNLFKDMFSIAEKGDADREDDQCGILYGMLRDSSYEIKQIAESEKEKHIKKGWWK